MYQTYATVRSSWHCYGLRPLLTILFFLLFQQGFSQVSGTVFRDLNHNGTQQAANPIEPGEFGVTVRAYNAAGVLLGTKTTSATGAYSFSAAEIPASTAVRIEFSPASGDFSGKSSATANGTNVQFVTAGAAVTANYAVAYSGWYTPDMNPYMATNAFTNGDALGGGTAGTNNNLFILPYDMGNGTPNNGGATRRAANSTLGSVFGLTFQNQSRTLLMSAYLKRHSGFGPNGIGAIYKSAVSTTGVPATPSLLVDVSAIGINVGTNPRSAALPANSNGPNTDVGVFAEVGKRGIGGIDLSDDGTELYLVNMFEKKLQRIAVGNPLKASFTAADVTGSWVITGPGIAGTEWLPMACKVFKGKVYVGGVSSRQTTTAHNIADTANLRGVVYEFDPATQIFTEVLRFPLSYRRGHANRDYRYEFRMNYWCAWQNSGNIALAGPLRTGLIGATTGNNATGIYYPQPMLSGIEFDIDGSMILGIRDRFGDQGGYANLFESGNVGGETYRTLAMGETMRAGKATGANQWTYENNASTTTNGVTTTTVGVTTNNPALTGTFTGQTGTPYGGTYGPGGLYFYYNQDYSNAGVPATLNTPATAGVNAHYVKSNGGLAFLAGSNEITYTAMDPEGVTFVAGLLRNFNSGANAGNLSQRIQLVATITTPIQDPSNMGKACAVGDVELLGDAMPVEIGNRIWTDTDNDGIQDAGEAGISGLTVTLRSPGADGIYNTLDDETWTTTTSATGEYYFTAANMTPQTAGEDNRRPASWAQVTGVLPGFDYRIEVATPAGTRLTLTDQGGPGSDHIDNDAFLVGVLPTVNVNTKNNQHNYDIGFTARAGIGDRVWRDDNGNGTQDSGEPGVAGITVQLFTNGTDGNPGTADDVLIASTVTDAYGNYLFSNLTPTDQSNATTISRTSFNIQFTPPANYTFTTANTPGDNANNGNSDANATTGRTGSFNLGSNELDLTVDAGIIFNQPTTTCLGDRVWIDANSNGTQDAGEAGMAGVTVSLYKDLNTDGDLNDAGENIPFATTITDANGNYSFCGLTAGSYQVGTTLPAAFRYTTAGGDNVSGSGGDSGTDSDVVPATGKTNIITVTGGTSFTNVDIGLVANGNTTASVGDLVWNDLNQNGVQDAGEPGVPGVTVTLYAQNGTTVLGTTVTDAFGNYMFTNLTGATNYVIGITVPASYTLTASNAGADDFADNDILSASGNKTLFFNLPNGARNLSIDGGIYQTTPAGSLRLGDKVWFDEDRDGIQDLAEIGVPGVTVSLYTNGPDGNPGTGDDVLVGTTTTDANGNYLFVNLAASTGASTNYNVGFSNIPNAYTFTTKDQAAGGGTDANDSDADLLTGRTTSINLTANNFTIDAGLVSGKPAGRASLGNKVWLDRDNDNLQDIGEPGISGITVTLKTPGADGIAGNADDVTVGTQTTNALGEYLFTGLAANTYFVEFSNLPGGFTVVTANTGTDDAIDSDGAAPSAGVSRTGNYILTEGEDNLTVDLGLRRNAPQASISDRVFFDIDADGNQDAGEPGVSGVTVTLYNNAGTPVATTVTDVNGYYLFDGLFAGTYTVGFSNFPPGLGATRQDDATAGDVNDSDMGSDGRTGPIALAANQNIITVDAGLVSTRAALGNYVWEDRNGNGIQDGGEPGVPGVTVSLYFDANNDGDFNDAGENLPVASMITNQNGEYLFTNLNAGNYQVGFTTIPGGLKFTTKDQTAGGGNDTNDSDVFPATGLTATVTLAAGQVNLTVDAGLVLPTAQIGNFVWADSNSNGIQDATEKGLGGVLVTLINAGPDGLAGTGDDANVAATVTNGNGGYLFNNVAPGNYFLQFGNGPAAAPFTTRDQTAGGGNDTNDSDVDPATGRIPVFSVPVGTVNLTFDAGIVVNGSILAAGIEFTAVKRNTIAELNWALAAEAGNRVYVVERAADGRNFTTIGTVTVDNSGRYRFNDQQPLAGINYYRIRIEKQTGAASYSDVRVLSFSNKGQVQVFPNPARENVYVQLPEDWQGQQVSISLFNAGGQLVLIAPRQQATQIVTLRIDRLPAGTYTLGITHADGTRITQRLQIVQ
jgi:SdrD B-like domain/Secretion system C-terminal sorting domain